MLLARRALVASVLVAGGVVFTLGAGLAPETFVAGDSGVKLVATRNVLAHPEAPLEIPLPVIGGEPVPYVDPFYRVHGTHRHAVTPELFPFVTAPLLSALGPRGIYVWPAVGWLVALAAWAWMAVALDPRRSCGLAFAVAGLCTPWLFYALEFWEHAPALGAAALGTAFLAAATSRDRWFVRRGLPAAASFSVAVLLRPEAACYVAAVLLMAWPTGLRRLRELAGTTLATGLLVVPVVVYTQLHFGVAATPHLSGLADGLESGWLALRGHLIWTWFAWPSVVNVWFVAPACLLVLWPAMPAGKRPRLLWAWLFLSSALTVLGVLVFAPNDGGAQWGPRYLLLAYGPLVPLVADRLQALWRRGGLGVAVVVCALLGSAWVQRTAYRELRGAKDTYGRVLSFVRQTTPVGGYVLTDLWWLDQVAASAHDRSFLFTDSPDRVRDVFARLDGARVPEATVIRSGESGTWRDADLSSPCYREAGRTHLDTRALLAMRYARVCP